jgi:hypothetical protein
LPTFNGNADTESTISNEFNSLSRNEPELVLTNNATSASLNIVLPNPAANTPTITQVSNWTEIVPTHQSLEESTITESTIEPEPLMEQPKPKPPRRPGGLIGAIQYFTLIVPDALRPGRNTTSLLNKQSIDSILKIIGSVAFLNVTGVVDNSVALGTSNPVRELVSGVSSLVLCNPVVQSLNGGRCGRKLWEGETIEHVLQP